MASSSSPRALRTCRATGASDGAKYFSPWLGTCGGGAASTCRLSALLAKLSPPLSLVCLKEVLSDPAPGCRNLSL